MQTKPIFKSKTAVAGMLSAIAGALGLWSEPVGQFLANHASAIITGLGVLHTVLRLVTRGRVTLLGD